MTDSIATAFLFLTAEYFLLPCIIIGYIWLDKDVFLQALKIMLFGMILNTALKVTFQVPLSPLLGKAGFAFPSGHMQLATTFFGWLLFKSRVLILRVLITAAIIGIGMGLVHFGYHNYHDVIAALFFGGLTIIGYHLLITKYNHYVAPIIIILSTVLVTYICLRFELTPGHIWMAYYSLLGIMLGEKLCRKNSITHNWRQKAANTIFCLLGLVIIGSVFSEYSFNGLDNFKLDIKSLLGGILLPLFGAPTNKKS